MAVLLGGFAAGAQAARKAAEAASQSHLWALSKKGKMGNWRMSASLVIVYFCELFTQSSTLTIDLSLKFLSYLIWLMHRNNVLNEIYAQLKPLKIAANPDSVKACHSQRHSNVSANTIAIAVHTKTFAPSAEHQTQRCAAGGAASA